MSEQDSKNTANGGWGDGTEDWSFEPIEGEDSDPATAPTPLVEATPLPAHIDQDVVEAVEDAPAAWFGIQFEQIPAELRQEAWIELRRWVDRFIVQHNMYKEVHPCWFGHPDVVNELYATMCAEYKVWEEGAPGVGPFLSFQTYLPGLRQRLLDSTQKFCDPTEHKWKQHEPLRYDETAWCRARDTVTTTVAVPRDKSATVGVRVATEEGEVTSNVVKMGAVTKPDRVVPRLEVLERAAPYEVSVSATHHVDDKISWQVSTGDEWADLALGMDGEAL